MLNQQFKDKQNTPKKQFFKIFGITIAAVLIFIGIFMVIIQVIESNDFNERINARYNNIVTEVDDEDFDSALQDLKIFKDDYGSESKKISLKISELENDIELKLYNNRSSEDIGISVCETYLEYYPNGKYTDEIKNSLSELSEKQATENINTAKSYISKNDVLAANDELQSVINNSYVSDSLKQQADELSKSIASKVADEKGKKLILGTWTKATGVQYIFEENGHMSMKLLSNYDASAGTALDGFEVKGILKEIDESGRILRGGLWEYNGIVTQNDKQFAHYTLLSQSSYHDCIIQIDKQDRMGVILQSGIGDISYLFR